VRDEATTVVARDGHSEINNVEEFHLLILPLIGERNLHSFVDSFAAAADDEGRGKRNEEKKSTRKRGQGKREGMRRKEREQREETSA